MNAEITLRVDGSAGCTIDTRTTLLDAMRERLGITSPRRRAATMASAEPAPCCLTVAA